MKRFDIVKTAQLVVLVVLAVIAGFIVFGDDELYQAIANEGHVRALCTVLWLGLGSSFAFLLYDFGSYAQLRRENTELDYAVYSDRLTGIANRYSCDAYIGQFAHWSIPSGMACVTMDLTSLPRINAAAGHEAGDAAIRDFSDILAKASDGRCFVGRNGGNKFLAIFESTNRTALDAYVADVAKAVAARNEGLGEAALEYDSGSALAGEEGITALTELVALSDRRATSGEGRA